MRWLIAIAIVACAIQHHVRILMGPSPDQPSTGFECKDPNASQPLLGRAYANNALHFTLVVDIIDLGDRLPSCLAEDIAASCQSTPCKLLATSRRFCQPLDIPITSLNDAPQEVTSYLDQNYPTIMTNTPHRPVLVRAALTTDTDCATLTTAVDGEWPTLKSDATHTILGCAYSCPAVLDDVGDTITLGLDVGLGQISNDVCIEAIDACATFPN